MRYLEQNNWKINRPVDDKNSCSENTMRAGNYPSEKHEIRLTSRLAGYVLALCLTVFCSLGSQAGPFDLEPASEWKLKKDKNDIQIYTQKIKGIKHRAVKAEASVEGITAHAVIAVILDAEACPNWADLCKRSFVHSTKAADDYYVYTENDLPSPVKNRDAVNHVKWHIDPESGAAIMNSIATPDVMEKQPRNVRIRDARIQWIIEPTETGVNIRNWALIDPVGIPSWISNQLLVGAPFKTLSGLIAEAKKEPYSSASSEFYDGLSSESEGHTE